MQKTQKTTTQKPGWYKQWHDHILSEVIHYGLLIVVVLLIGVLFINKTKPDPLESGAALQVLPLTFVTTHPEAALQPTDSGKALRGMFDFEGKLYMGYGDWGANTGPIKICPYDPITNLIACEKDALNPTEDFLMRTEQIASFTVINGRLCAAAIDPGGGGNHELACRNSNGTWEGYNSPCGFAHVFDIATLNGKDVFIAGSAWGAGSDDGYVCRSPDGGMTWDGTSAPTTLDVLPTKTSAGFNRLHFLGKLKGKMYTQSPYYTSSRVYDPATGKWSVGPNLLQASKNNYYTFGSTPVEFAGRMVYSTSYPGAGYGKMLSFDGSRITETLKPIIRQYSSIKDQQIYNGYLYTLAAGNTDFAIIRSQNLTKWELVGNIPNPTSGNEYPWTFRILNDTIYVGTYNAKIYSSPMPATTIPLN